MSPPDTTVRESEPKTESQGVSTQFDPHTTQRLKKAALIFAAVLAVAFVIVRIDRYFKDRAIARAADQTLTAPHAVDVIEAKPVGAVERFALPGQTAAWHQSTIYARVNGYVARWLVDIGDRVHMGQLLAVIETPELDAELAAARAEL